MDLLSGLRLRLRLVCGWGDMRSLWRIGVGRWRGNLLQVGTKGVHDGVILQLLCVKTKMSDTFDRAGPSICALVQVQLEKPLTGPRKMTRSFNNRE